jgi:hypothetical protein
MRLFVVACYCQGFCLRWGILCFSLYTNRFLIYIYIYVYIYVCIKYFYMCLYKLQIAKGPSRDPYTMPPLVFRALSLIRAIYAKEQAGEAVVCYTCSYS